MQYIRDTYNIPIKRGMKVCVGGKIGWIKELRWKSVRYADAI